jgi:transposase
VKGRISKAGDADVRRALYEAASGLMTRIKGKDKVKSWVSRSPNALATARRWSPWRKLAVIMHAM